MKFNVVFNVITGKKVNRKFEVVEGNIRYDKSDAKQILKKKYPRAKIEVLKISQHVTALSEII